MNARAMQAVLLAMLALSGVPPSVSRANELRLGAAAPPAVLVTLDGRRIATADLTGQVVILTFWATWCVPCRDELPLLSAYERAHAAQGLTVLAFSLDTPDNLARVREIARNYAFPSGLLAVSSAPGYGRIWHIPVNFTIDRQGVLIDDGWKDKPPVWTAERLERIVTPLLLTSNSLP
jgi:cytochrome c biogenesis protein CcmG/thiol:disulfide interchange protein DsbE